MAPWEVTEGLHSIGMPLSENAFVKIENNIFQIAEILSKCKLFAKYISAIQGAFTPSECHYLPAFIHAPPPS